MVANPSKPMGWDINTCKSCLLITDAEFLLLFTINVKMSISLANDNCVPYQRQLVKVSVKNVNTTSSYITSNSNSKILYCYTTYRIQIARKTIIYTLSITRFLNTLNASYMNKRINLLIGKCQFMSWWNEHKIEMYLNKSAGVTNIVKLLDSNKCTKFIVG